MCVQINSQRSGAYPFVRINRPTRSQSASFLFCISAIAAGVVNGLGSGVATATTPTETGSQVDTETRSQSITETQQHGSREAATLAETFTISSFQPTELANSVKPDWGSAIAPFAVLNQPVLNQSSGSSEVGQSFWLVNERKREAIAPVFTVPSNQNVPTLPNLVAQTTDSNGSPINTAPLTKPSPDIRRQGSEILGKPSIQLQGVYVLQGNESSARARVNALYPVSPTALFGAVVDLTTGDAFSDSPGAGLRLNELYFAYAPFDKLPGMRFVVGLMDLTSYFDRNSFAKDGASHFFNRAFQTNPALSAAGLSSRPGLLMNWSVTDNFEIKAAGFSSSRKIWELTLDSFAAEAGVRAGNFIARGTFVTSRDAGQDTGFEEIYSIPRSRGFGLRDGDRENAFGLNGEYYVPSLKLGFFARYGWYDNVSLGESATTYSFGAVRLDLFTKNDRLGIAYGRQLSNDDLRRDRDDKIPDVLEVYYDLPVAKFLRVGVTFQERNQFSETIVGFRVKTEFSVLGRLFE